MGRVYALLNPKDSMSRVALGVIPEQRQEKALSTNKHGPHVFSTPPLYLTVLPRLDLREKHKSQVPMEIIIPRTAAAQASRKGWLIYQPLEEC